MSEFGTSGKWLELLKEIVPRVARAGVLRDSSAPGEIGQFAAIQTVAPSIAVQLIPLDVRDASEIELAIAKDVGLERRVSDVGSSRFWIGTPCLWAGFSSEQAAAPLRAPLPKVIIRRGRASH